MMFYTVTNLFGKRWLCFLALVLGLFAAGRLAVAGGAPEKAKAGPSWPALEQFRKVSPANRLRLIEKAGLLTTAKVTRSVLSLEIVERGSLAAVRSSDIVCSLRARTQSNWASTIKWVIDPGTAVKKGDKLVELDDGALQDELKERTLALEQARTGYRNAQDNLKRVQTDNEIAARLAEITVRLAELRLKRGKGEDRDLKEELELNVDQARLGLQRVKALARTTEAAAQAVLGANTAVVDLENNRKNEVAAELPKCVLRAPQDGVVIYYVPEQIRGGGAQQAIVAQGEPVREGQKLLEIPDLSQFQVDVRVHETLVSRLRNADPLNKSGWQRAKIRVDAYPSRVLAGHVKTVDTVASQQDFFASDVKVYKTVVAVDTPLDGLKPGMSTEVTITAQQTAGPVLTVPVLSILASGKKQFCYVVTDKEVQEREVVTGLRNDRFVEIKSGLKEGELVLPSPRALLRRLTSSLDQGGNSVRRPEPAPILVRSVKPINDDGLRRSWVATYGLTYQDLGRIAALPVVHQAVPVRSFAVEARRLDRVANAQLQATTPAYAEVKRLEVAEGRFLIDEDNENFRNVAVLGSKAADSLFPGEEPLGASIVVSKHNYVVVGVLCEQDEAVSRPAAWEANTGIFLPLRTCHARFGERVIIRQGGRRTGEAVPLHSILVTVRHQRDVSGTVEDIRDILEQAHPITDWSVQGQAGSLP